MKIITREIAMKNLKEHKGQDLMKLARKYGVITFKNGKQNKGWKGQVLERLAGLNGGTSRDPNGETFELKSVSFYYVRSNLVPKETMAITMINPRELKKYSFFESHCWSKLKSMIFCAVMWHGKNARRAELLEVESLDFIENDDLVQGIKKDYDFIRNKLIKEGFDNLTGKDGIWIQARTKGRGHGSKTRAFYARKNLVAKIFELGN